MVRFLVYPTQINVHMLWCVLQMRGLRQNYEKAEKGSLDLISSCPLATMYPNRITYEFFQITSLTKKSLKCSAGELRQLVRQFGSSEEVSCCRPGAVVPWVRHQIWKGSGFVYASLVSTAKMNKFAANFSLTSPILGLELRLSRLLEGCVKLRDLLLDRIEIIEYSNGFYSDRDNLSLISSLSKFESNLTAWPRNEW